MKTKQQKLLFIEALRKTPIIQVVCERTGISRTTYYRWKEVDEDFADAVSSALNEGIALVNDMAETQLITSIKEKNMSAIAYWLNHRHPAYARRLISSEQKTRLSPEQLSLIQTCLKIFPPNEPVAEENDK